MFSGASAGKPTEQRSNRLELALWWQVLRRVQEELGRNHVSMMSAGVAFYILLSIFPALSALISIYGLLPTAALCSASSSRSPASCPPRQ